MHTCNPCGRGPSLGLRSFCDDFDNPPVAPGWEIVQEDNGGTVNSAGPSEIQLLTGAPKAGIFIQLIDPALIPQFFVHPAGDAADDFCLAFRVRLVAPFPPDPAALSGWYAGLIDDVAAPTQFLVVHTGALVTPFVPPNPAVYKVSWISPAGAATFETMIPVDNQYHDFQLCRAQGGPVTLSIDGSYGIEFGTQAQLDVLPTGPLRPFLGIRVDAPDVGAGNLLVDRLCLDVRDQAVLCP